MTALQVELGTREAVQGHGIVLPKPECPSRSCRDCLWAAWTWATFQACASACPAGPRHSDPLCAARLAVPLHDCRLALLRRQAAGMYPSAARPAVPLQLCRLAPARAAPSATRYRPVTSLLALALRGPGQARPGRPAEFGDSKYPATVSTRRLGSGNSEQLARGPSSRVTDRTRKVRLVRVDPTARADSDRVRACHWRRSLTPGHVGHHTRLVLLLRRA